MSAAPSKNLVTNQVDILIIDDDLSYIDLLKLRIQQIIERPNLNICHSLKETEEFLNSGDSPKEFDLVIIDQHLPDGLGSDFISKGLISSGAILSMSSDECEEIPANAIGAGASFFLSKTDLSKKLFEYLLQGLIQRNQLAKELLKAEKDLAKLEVINKLTSTFKHEVNNPLAAIFGAVFLLKKKTKDLPDLKEAVALVDESSKRIQKIVEAFDQQTIPETKLKGNKEVYHVPGDKDWK